MRLSPVRARVFFRRQSRITRIFLLAAALGAALWVIDGILLWQAGEAVTATAVSGWLRLAVMVAALLGSIVLVRWIRRRVMWRLRNRLIVTYVFIGVIPVLLLLAMGFIANYIFAGQFAGYVANAEVRSELRALDAANVALAAEVAEHIRRDGLQGRGLIEPPPGVKTPAPGFADREVTAWFRGEPRVLQAPAQGRAHPLSRPAWMGDHFRGLAYEGERLFLRTATSVPVGGEVLTVISSVPADERMLGRVASALGEMLVVIPGASGARPQATDRLLESLEESGQDARRDAVRISSEGMLELQVQGRARTLRVGELAAAVNRWDRAIVFGSDFPATRWEDGSAVSIFVGGRTRPSVLYQHLFVTAGQVGGAAIIALVVIAVVFAAIEFIALLVGVRLTRTITRSVANLWEATERVNQGDLSHRIAVQSNDQLAALESSFNSMMASLQRLLVEQKEKERLQSELSIAQEVQAQLFPRQVDQLATLEVEGVCRPARIVSGDYYDFIRLGEDELVLAVGDVSGKGISAALMMATLHSAVRAYEFGRVNEVVRRELAAVSAAGAGSPPRLGGNGEGPQGLQNPGRVLQLLNRHLYLSTPAEKYATLFLGLYDGRTRRLTYSNAGHLPPLLLRRDGTVQRLHDGGTVAGLFPELQYEERTVALQPGDLFLAYSDGVTEPENEYGEFGEQRLLDLVLSNRDLPLADILDLVASTVHDWIGAQEQPDDLTLVLARVR